MEIEISNLNKPYYIDQDVTFDPLIYKHDEIKSIEYAHASGTVSINNLNIIKIDLQLEGELNLIDTITLEDYKYPFKLNIDEEYTLDDKYFEEYYLKDKNTLDILSVLWENIVLEVPIRHTNSKEVTASGEGWCLGENKNDGIDPRLAKLNELLDKRKE